MKGNNVFKKFPLCGFEWDSCEEFLQDDSLKIIGYQANFIELMSGIFLFNHSCKTTLAIKAGDFADLYGGPIFKVKATGSEECPEFCLYQNELVPCPVECECAHVREIIQVIKNPAKL